MPGKRSRQGCEECRKRRRKCDETKPACGPCVSFRRPCNYTLKLVWGGRPETRGATSSSPSSRHSYGSGGTLPPLGTGVSFAVNNSSSSSSRGGGARHVGRGDLGPSRMSSSSSLAATTATTAAISTSASSLVPSVTSSSSPSSSFVTSTIAGDTWKRGSLLHPDNDGGTAEEDGNAVTTHTTLVLIPAPSTAPPRLPNGVPLSPPYQRLLDYFAKDILASLSVHPSIHQDLCQGLVPTMLHSPHLLSAGLALSAAGLVSRGLSDVAGVDIMRVIEHLQSSGLALLRHALQRGLRNSVLMATCLLWCLADVFAAGGTAVSPSTSDSEPSSSSLSSPPSSLPSSSSSSWRIHLQGVKALLGGDQAFEALVTSAGSSRSAMRHLYLLYLSLQTLPYVPPAGGATRRRPSVADGTLTAVGDALRLVPPPPSSPPPTEDIVSPPEYPMIDEAAEDLPLLASLPLAGGPDSIDPPRIDGFLGYSEELLDILQQIDHIANMPPGDPGDPPAPHPAGRGQDADQGLLRSNDDLPTTHDDFSLASPHLSGAARGAADVLLGKALGLIRRDAATALPVAIAAAELSAASGREFVLCHRSFQQATLIHLYRRLFRLPSGAAPIQAAVAQIHRMAGQMTQGAPCNTWVAMSMPLFTVGCEACTPAQQAWSHASLDTLAASIGSMHVRVVRQALEDVWRLRARRGDTDGRLCAGQLLDELSYNIILF